MKAELENEIYKIDPVFFKHALACQEGKENGTQTCMTFGCECGDGWFKPLKRFVQKVAVLNQNGSFHFVCDQLKEKFGELCVYYSYEEVKDGENKVSQEDADAIFAMFKDALEKATEDCWDTCERCGKTNDWCKRDIVTTKGWIRRICRECAQKRDDYSVEQYDKQHNKEHRARIVDFASGYDFLSMWHKGDFTFNDNRYSNIWSAYFIELLKDKVAGFKDEFGYGSILMSVEPIVAYHLGKKLSYGTNNDTALMKSVLKAKYSYDFLKNLLLNTKGKEIVYFNTVHDSFWGVDPAAKSENMLGKLMVEVRDEF